MRLAGLALALASLAAGEHLKRLDTSLTIITNNDLQGSNSPYADSAVILTDPVSRDASRGVCSRLNEKLWQPVKSKRVKRASSSLYFADYLKYTGAATSSSKFWISNSDAVDTIGRVTKGPSSAQYQALCTNTAPYSNQSFQDTNEKWHISLDVNNQTLTGFRDRLSFRFLGIRYAPQPQRFGYPTLFKGSGESVSALEYGSQCFQWGSGSEDCLFLNIWTPYLPNPNKKTNKKTLRPVAFWIHGGAFIGGTANDATFDGANMASRGDMVVVAINYRVSALGFLALNDGVTNGNYGLADQITALEWVRQHIHHFGGDPDRITIFGQSAGAASVRALIASPKSVGKFSNAIMLSNLGGIHYGTTYSRYYTIEEQVAVAANQLLEATGCSNAASQVECLRQVPASTLSTFTDVRFLVVDGTYLTSRELPLDKGKRYPVNLMMGITRDDGAPFVSYPQTTNRTEYLASVDLPNVPLKLFPQPNTGNGTRDVFWGTSRIATDGIFRCADQATAFAGLSNNRFDKVYYYEFDRTYQPGGWPELDLCNAPRSAKFPHGDPSKDYLRCHSGELYYVFGNLHRQGLPMRDDGDLPFEQFVTDSFVSFIRTGDPNPDEAYLRAKGYTETLKQLKISGTWKPSVKGRYSLRVFDYPKSRMEPFRDIQQCEALGLGLGYYM